MDSIKWVRCDSIVIGCFQVNEDDEEIDYMIQVITTTEPGFGEVGHSTTCRQAFMFFFYFLCLVTCHLPFYYCKELS